MLKIMKYDWRNGWNAVKSTLLIAAIFSVVLGILLGVLGGEPVINENAFAVSGESAADRVVIIMSVIWFAVMLALLVQTVDAIACNMVSRMFGKEGNLTHTLPVETWELLLGKSVRTWIFGVFMVFVAIASVLLVMLTTAASTGFMRQVVFAIIQFMPKLGAYHFKALATEAGYLLYGVAAFLAWSFLIVVQFQFICIAARQFGRFHVAGGFIVFSLLAFVEGNLNQAFSMGFLIFLIFSAACFYGSWWLIRKRLAF